MPKLKTILIREGYYWPNGREHYYGVIPYRDAALLRVLPFVRRAPIIPNILKIRPRLAFSFTWDPSVD